MHGDSASCAVRLRMMCRTNNGRRLRGAFVRLLFAAAVASVMMAGATAYAALPVEGPAATASYWQRADGDTPLLTEREMTELNMRIAGGTGTLNDLDAVPKELFGNPIPRYIAKAAQDFTPDTVPGGYLGGARLTPERWRAIWENCAADTVPEKSTVYETVTLRRTDVRLLPCRAGLYASPEETRYDALQGTVLDPGTPVLLFHTSADGAYGFISASDYDGWVRMADLATDDRGDWFGRVAPRRFAVVTAPTLRVDTGEETLLYELGAHIPMVTWGPAQTLRIRVPARDAEGRLATKYVPLPAEGLSIGAVTPTHNNLMRLAFAPLGTEYGWGGENGGMDCSSYVRNIYRAMGIVLPRDADEQERAMGQISMEGLPTAERWARLKEMPPGSLLFRPGHVMLYLGTDRSGTPLVIHDISSYYEDGAKRYVRRVVVSDLNFQNARGIPAIDTLTHMGRVLP